VITQIIENTECIIAECNFEFEFKTPKNKTYYTNSGENDMQLLRLANEVQNIWQYNVLHARVEKELKVIDELKFSGYFFNQLGYSIVTVWASCILDEVVVLMVS
jgi:DNA polymerase-3 subunit alpha/error-prone DNA polymerase